LLFYLIKGENQIVISNFIIRTQFLLYTKLNSMPVEKINNAPTDDNAALRHEDDELDYWSEKFGITKEKIKEALAKGESLASTFLDHFHFKKKKKD